MKIATWNVNGIRARQAQFAEWVERERPDVVCLQEIKAKPDQIPESCGLPGYTCYWHGAGGYSGVGLHIRGEAFEAAEAALQPSPVRSRDAHRPGRGRPDGLRLRLRAERREGLPREDGVPAGARGIRRSRFTRRGSSSSSAATSTSRAPSATSIRRSGSRRRSVSCRRSGSCSRRSSRTVSSTSAARSIPTTTSSSPGGRRGATCASETSAGASITSWRPSRSPGGPSRAASIASSAPAITGP